MIIVFISWLYIVIEWGRKITEHRKWRRFQMASSSFKIIHVLVFCAWILIPTSSQSHPHQHEKHAALFIFRDSLYDAGNNNYINTTTDYQQIAGPMVQDGLNAVNNVITCLAKIFRS